MAAGCSPPAQVLGSRIGGDQGSLDIGRARPGRWRPGAPDVADHYDFIKSYQHLNQETYDAIEDAAHTAHLITMGHLPEIGCPSCVSREHPFMNPMNDIAHAEELGRYAMQNDLDPGELVVLPRVSIRHRLSG